MTTTTHPAIERPDDGLAVLTLTGQLDEATAAAIRDNLALLAEEGRRYVAIDLADTWGGSTSGIASLARQAEKQRAAGGDLFLIHAPAGYTDSIKARRFKDRAFWDRFGGVRLLPKPHPVRYATEAQITRDAEWFYGVPIVELGEDGEQAFTLGHHSPRRFLAALLAYTRNNLGCDLADVGLDRVGDLAAFGEKATGWSVLYTHAGRVTLGMDAPGDDPDWCVCDEGGGWWAHEAAEGAEHAVPTMTYWIGG